MARPGRHRGGRGRLGGPSGSRPFATVDNRWPEFIWFEELLIRTDPDFYERLMEGKESYTDPVVKGVMEEWRSMIEADYFTNLDLSMDTNLTAGLATARWR